MELEIMTNSGCNFKQLKTMVSKEKQELAQAAQMILDGVEGIMKILPSVELLPGDRRVHPTWIAFHLSQAVAIGNYFKSSVDSEDGTFNRNRLSGCEINKIQDSIDEDFKEKGFDYEVEKN